MDSKITLMQRQATPIARSAYTASTDRREGARLHAVPMLPDAPVAAVARTQRPEPAARYEEMDDPPPFWALWLKHEWPRSSAALLGILGLGVGVASGTIWGCAAPGVLLAALSLDGLRRRIPLRFSSGFDDAAPLLPEQNSDSRVADLERRLGVLSKVHEELAAAKVEAESALLSKGEFLATMSHEVRTPLNGMVPLLELVLASPLAPEQKDQLDTIHRSSRELLRIVNDVLDYSRVEAGGVELETIGLNLRELVEHVTKLMEKPAQAKGLSLSYTIDSNVRLAVRGDPLRLRQMLTNLVSNAIKFTERGSIVIEVAKRAETRTHNTVLISVRDTGIGLQPEAAQRLFQPFSQADASTTRRFGGTGLGLAICRRLVESMAGQIGVTSQPGRGSTFWFSVPLLKAIGDMEARPVGEDLRALLLCRDTPTLERLTRRLRALRVQTITSETTLDALRILRGSAGLAVDGRQELVLVDFQTYHATIRSLTRSIESEESLGEVRTIVLGDATKLPEELRSNPRIGVVPREASEQQLGDAIATLFRGREEGSQAPAASGPVIDISARKPNLNLAGLRILLVDDIAINRKVGERVLEKLGAVVELASNGREALQRMDRGRYDAVLMDCQMPDVDGYTATRAQRVREHEEKRRRIPIIAMTANAMPGDREKCLAAGMDDHIPKPLDRDLVALTLERWIRESAGETDAPAPVPALPPSVVDVEAHFIPDLPGGIDASALMSMFDGLGLDQAQCVERWYRDTRLSITTIGTAVSMFDAATAQRSARALKSAGALLGAHVFSMVAASIEAAAQAGALQQVAEELSALEIECERVRRALSVVRVAG